MELLLILFILACGVMCFILLTDDALPSANEGAEPDAELAEREPDVDYSFNPTTGLPMWDEGPDGLDLEGNMWSSDDETLPMHRHPADQSLFHDSDELFGLELEHSTINPATGLPMMGGLDVDGNPYGSSNLDDTFSSGGGFESDWGSDLHGTGSIDDSFGSGSSSLDSFDSGSGSSGLSGTGFGSDW